MLNLFEITKDYKVADTTVRALKNLSLSFRRNEFVCILGPSGCGKTTLLNIIGGLDKYTSGDLTISGKSTKEFVDRDWDIYRNHRVGFIFQSYNLIPHQTVLGNVELALTIAGMNKTERTEKAKKALDKVGLSDQYTKRPNQLSGGQCQRVAIARALVNDPEILLADEPTGALDTTTSVQIMDLIAEIASEKLVIMVTHNPELAEKYSTRIIQLLDGELQSDNNPLSDAEEKEELQKLKVTEHQAAQAAKTNGKIKKPEKAKMSFWTAFRLSIQNLFTKKARTIMTSIAGSIGIIGVSLVLSISFGVQTFINNMQNDMLSGNPIQIRESGMDIAALIRSTSRDDQSRALNDLQNGYINVDSMIDYLVSRSSDVDNLMLKNNITQDYIDYVLNISPNAAGAVFLDYSLDVTNNIYTDYYESKAAREQSLVPNNISLSTIQTIYTALLNESPYSQYSDYITGLTDVFMPLPSKSTYNSNESYINNQYKLINGKYATAANEVMIVLEKDSMLTDLLLAQLGYYSQDEFMNLIFKATPNADGSLNKWYDSTLDKDKFSYEELLGKSFTWYPNDTVFEFNYDDTVSSDRPRVFDYNAYSKDFWVTDTGALPLKVVGILEPNADLSYGCLESGFFYTEALREHIYEQNKNSVLVNTLKTLAATKNTDSISSGINTAGTYAWGITYKYSYTFLYTDDGTPKVVTDRLGAVGTTSTYLALAGSILQDIPGLSELAAMKNFSLRQAGGLNTANQIFVFPVDFRTKDDVLSYLDRWDSDETLTFYSASQGKEITLGATERSNIHYTDTLSLIVAIINNLINIVTFSLIGFTSLALVVSCVMIGIITYVSVVERVKEIGVIRSLGGRKKDISYLFNAETFIIGLISGLIGIAVTYLGSLIINIIINVTQGIKTIAIFPWYYAVMMVGVSIALTLISGFLPSRSAAKKDPVVALRSE